MSQPAKAQEPSMEEILASIRRIIADDDANKTVKPELPPAPVVVAPARPAPPPPPRPVAPPPAALNQDDVDAVLAEAKSATPPADDVLDLTEANIAPAPAFRTIAGGTDDIVFADRPADHQPEPRVVEEPRRPAPPMPDRGLLAGSTAAAVDSAFNSLANTVFAHNSRTLEDLVKEMLRPMLKSWLDDNLPGLVERIVRAEIERVSRGR